MIDSFTRGFTQPAARQLFCPCQSAQQRPLRKHFGGHRRNSSIDEDGSWTDCCTAKHVCAGMRANACPARCLATQVVVRYLIPRSQWRSTAPMVCGLHLSESCSSDSCARSSSCKCCDPVCAPLWQLMHCAPLILACAARLQRRKEFQTPPLRTSRRRSHTAWVGGHAPARAGGPRTVVAGWTAWPSGQNRKSKPRSNPAVLHGARCVITICE